jgi:hypothetical protein
MDTFFQLIIIAAGFVCGSAIILIVKLLGLTFPISSAVLLVLTLPLVSAFVAEGFTGLWLHTPGSVGLGPLMLFIPMLVAGFICAVSAIVMQKLMLPFDPYSARSSETLTQWVALAITCSFLTLSLWRFWPAPAARLW